LFDAICNNFVGQSVGVQPDGRPDSSNPWKTYQLESVVSPLFSLLRFVLNL